MNRAKKEQKKRAKRVTAKASRLQKRDDSRDAEEESYVKRATLAIQKNTDMLSELVSGEIENPTECTFEIAAGDGSPKTVFKLEIDLMGEEKKVEFKMGLPSFEYDSPANDIFFGTVCIGLAMNEGNEFKFNRVASVGSDEGIAEAAVLMFCVSEVFLAAASAAQSGRLSPELREWLLEKEKHVFQKFPAGAQLLN